jgi:hypothetical protein
MINIHKFPTAVRVKLKGNLAEDRKALNEAGYRLIDGIADEAGAGYYPANSGGGYSSRRVACGHAVTVEAGSPGCHATVTVKG